MLSINQLRTFLEVARCGSVNAAAERLVVSQPAVSSALAGLQRSIGAALVARDGRGLRLTPAGERLATYGRRVVALLDEMVLDVRAVAAEKAATVRLAAVTTAAEQLVPNLLAGFARTAIELHVGNRDAVWDRLAHGEADIAVSGRPPDGRFRSCAVRPNALVVVAAADAAMDEAGLADATWLVREAGSGTRATSDALFEELGIAPRTVTIGSNAAILGCVRAGLGVSLLSRDTFVRGAERGDVREVPTQRTPLARDWHLVARAGESPAAGTRQFLQHCIAIGAFTAPAAGRTDFRASSENTRP
ncbi:MAG: LysR family transcriptional regulator [Candidatus Velthaea sp.]